VLRVSEEGGRKELEFDFGGRECRVHGINIMVKGKANCFLKLGGGMGLGKEALMQTTALCGLWVSTEEE